jgi:hypothetical protein
VQLFGVVLVLVGASRDLQMAVWGYSQGSPSLGSLLVVAGLLAAGGGLVGPALTAGGA